MLKQLIRFGLIGLLALGVHLSSVVLLVNTFNITPLLANLLGFLLAFQLSYWGHYMWTFEKNHLSHKNAVIRLFTVASCNFLINEALYASLLYHTKISYDLLLFIVLIFMSLVTFILSKYWVFHSN